MEYRKLGKTDMHLSIIGFGASPLGDVFDVTDEQKDSGPFIRPSTRVSISLMLLLFTAIRWPKPGWVRHWRANETTFFWPPSAVATGTECLIFRISAY